MKHELSQIKETKEKENNTAAHSFSSFHSAAQLKKAIKLIKTQGK